MQNFTVDDVQVQFVSQLSKFLCYETTLFLLKTDVVVGLRDTDDLNLL